MEKQLLTASGPTGPAHQPVRAGALTVLIAVVMLCLSVLAVLALSTAHADLQLAEKQQQALGREAQNLGEEWLARVDAALSSGGALPEDAQRLAEGEITGVVTAQDGTTLTIVISTNGTGSSRYRVLQWQIQRDWAADQTLDVWAGGEGVGE